MLGLPMMIHLYVKTHAVTGLKYFGKTTRDPFLYKGSGKYWRRHLKKHGNSVRTEIIGSFEDEMKCEQAALAFSRANHIVESDAWANMILENGRDGFPTDGNHSDEIKQKISKSLTGLPSPKSSYNIKDMAARIKRVTDATTGTIFINNGKITRRHKKEIAIPSGWTKGRIMNSNRDFQGKRFKDTFYVVNSKGVRKRLKAGTEIPEGFVRGYNYGAN